MRACSSVPVVSAFAAVLFLGCGDTPIDLPSSSGTDSPFSESNDNDAVVKIAVMADGSVFVNSEMVPIDSFSSKLDELGEITEIWFHREVPEAAEPLDNASRAFLEIVNRKLPIGIFLDPDFKRRTTIDGQWLINTER